jgi:hypothetical protein
LNGLLRERGAGREVGGVAQACARVVR